MNNINLCTKYSTSKLNLCNNTIKRNSFMCITRLLNNKMSETNLSTKNLKKYKRFLYYEFKIILLLFFKQT